MRGRLPGPHLGAPGGGRRGGGFRSPPQLGSPPGHPRLPGPRDLVPGGGERKSSRTLSCSAPRIRIQQPSETPTPAQAEPPGSGGPCRPPRVSPAPASRTEPRGLGSGSWHSARGWPRPPPDPALPGAPGAGGKPFLPSCPSPEGAGGHDPLPTPSRSAGDGGGGGRQGPACPGGRGLTRTHPHAGGRAGLRVGGS